MARIDTQPQVVTETVVDSDGWSRAVFSVPEMEGIRIAFKGRYDLPELESERGRAIEVSLRTLYSDETRGLGGGVTDEVQVAYAGARGTDPRLMMETGGLGLTLDHAVSEAEGRDVLLIAD